LPRGLGEYQKELSYLTTLKICAILSIKYFTYQDLQRESKIQRKILKCKLEKLHKQRIINKYYKTYSSQYNINSEYVFVSSDNKYHNTISYPTRISRYGTVYILNYNNTESINFVKEYYIQYYELSTKEINLELKPIPPKKINARDLTVKKAISQMLNTIQWLNYFQSQTKEKKVLKEEFQKQSKSMVELYNECIKPNSRYCKTPLSILENKKNAKRYLNLEPSKIQF
jgi:hypothetical protein